MIKNIIIFVMLLLMSNAITLAQGTTPNCTPTTVYVQQHDGTGKTPLDPTQLNTVAKELAQVFPEPYCSAFKVYDYGFTPISQYTKGGYAEDFELMKLQCSGADREQPYLLFAREVNEVGIVTKIWVDVKLPKGGIFACISEVQRSLTRIRVEKAVEEALSKGDKNVPPLVFAETAGINRLKERVIELMKCCGGKDQRDDLCGCSNEDVKEIVDTYKFESFEIDAVATQAANINTSTIHDVSNVKIDVAGSSDYIGKHLEEFTTSLNQKVGLNIQIVSNLNICFLGIDDYYTFAKEKEFGVVIIGNPKAANATDKENLKIDVFWNEAKKQMFDKKEDTEVFLASLKIKILQELGVIPSVSPNPLNVEYPFCQQTSFVKDGGLHDIEWFIQEVIKIENTAQQNGENIYDTKLMFTKFRKIFYNSDGWNTAVIRNAKKEGWYEPPVMIEASKKDWLNPIYCLYPLLSWGPVDAQNLAGTPEKFEYVEREWRPIINKGENKGKTPDIYCDNLECSNYNQEVKLPDGCLIDMGHVFTGIDALNYSDKVTKHFKLGSVTASMNWIVECSNNDGPATWLGDIGSVITEQLFRYDNQACKKGKLSSLDNTTIDDIIKHNSSGADMLGNMDAYVIFAAYIEGKPNNRLVSDILKEYYLEAGKDVYQKKRYSNFARKLGLIWDNNGFTNLNQKMGTYLTDMANFNLMLTIVGAGGLTYEAHKARFALTELRYFSDDEMKKHLNLFFKNLHTEIQSE